MDAYLMHRAGYPIHIDTEYPCTISVKKQTIPIRGCMYGISKLSIVDGEIENGEMNPTYIPTQRIV
eukprot:6197032-Pleurochrysis_carterae.AAC.2